jgi:hypothetical protein
VCGPRPVRPLLVLAALLAVAPALAACGAGKGTPLPYVAEFALGGDTAEAREFLLTPTPGPRLQVLPEPSHAPPITPAPSSGGPPSFEPSVAWVNDGRYLGVVTYGSGSCPSGPHGIEVVADQVVEIRLGPLFSDRDVCSADMSGHVTVVELPEPITPTQPLTARFGEREMTIPAISSG